jgi:hypothetical protein
MRPDHLWEWGARHGIPQVFLENHRSQNSPSSALSLAVMAVMKVYRVQFTDEHGVGRY